MTADPDDSYAEPEPDPEPDPDPDESPDPLLSATASLRILCRSSALAFAYVLSVLTKVSSLV